MVRSTRRTFLKMSWGTVALMGLPVPLFSQAGGSPPELTGGWSGTAGKARFRIDGLAKVLGDRIYARDFRVKNMASQNWPASNRMAMVIRADRADKVFEKLDLIMLPAGIQPETIVTQEQLSKDKIQPIFADTSPPGSDTQNRAQGFMVGVGEIPAFLGQPIAILVFKDANTYRKAKRILQFNKKVLVYGGPATSAEYQRPYVSPLYLTLYPNEAGGVAFSQTLYGHTTPGDCGSSESTEADCQAKRYRALIDKELDEAERLGWKLYEGTASTQVLDPMFMEPESGLAWYDAASHKTLHVLIGTQSPFGDIHDALTMFHGADVKYQVNKVVLTSCYPGGGFGGRDVSTFPPLLMLAAMYANGPVRMAHDRFEQFQSGLKQLGADMSQTMAVDKEGRFQALKSNLVMRAGGKNNYSQFVAELAGYCAGGSYWIPKASIDATADPSVGVVAGSMRGFGGPQAFFGLELLVEKIARDRSEDPIDLRKRNALRKDRGDVTVTGAPLIDPLPIAQICERAQAHPLWVERQAQKSQRSSNSLLYGVGFALANQAFGTGNDGVMAAISIELDGALLVHTNAVDMGNGAATTLACTTACCLGKNASDITMGQADLFQNSIQLSTQTPSSTSTKTKFERVNRTSVLHRVVHQTKDPAAGTAWAHPHYTSSYFMSSSACITAFHQVHAVTEASRLLFDTAVWPAAASLWGVDPADTKAKPIPAGKMRH